MKRIVLVNLFILSVVYSSTSLANDWLISVGFSLTSDVTRGEDTYSGGEYVSVWGAVPQAFTPQHGAYIGFGIPPNIFNNRNYTHSNQFTLLNAGLTYSLADNFLVYGGPGISYQRISSKTSNFAEHNYRFNLNVGSVIRFGNFGVNLSYDTAPKAFGIGFTTSSVVFQ